MIIPEKNCIHSHLPHQCWGSTPSTLHDLPLDFYPGNLKFVNGSFYSIHA